MKNRFLFILLTALVLGCASEEKNQRQGTRYAVWFDFKRTTDATELEIFSSDRSSAKYFLINKINKDLEPPAGYVKVRVPLKKIVCTSTTQIPWLEYLNATHFLQAFPNTRLIYSPTVRQRLDSGKILDIGKGAGLDYELLSSVETNVLLANPYGDLSKLEFLLKEKESALMLTRESEEQHPLGRAEWILLMGLLLDRFDMADSIFRSVEDSYTKAKNSVAKQKFRPYVFTGVPYSGIWHVPAGNNFLARLFEDAGYHYVWNDLEGGGTVPVGFESVFNKSFNADFWIGAGDFKNLSAITESDKRFGGFKSVSSQKVFVYDRSVLSGGGNAYFEFAGMRPDLLLSDLVGIRTGANPSSLTFYRRLKP